MTLRTISGIGFLLAAGSFLSAQQKLGPIVSTGIPPRASPADYRTQTQTGTVTIGADFMGHSVPTPEATFTTDQYIVIETGLYGKAGDRLTLSPDQFSLRINGKKSPLPSVPYATIFNSLKDPEWEEAQVSEKAEKSKTSVNGGGGANDPKPAAPKMPIGTARAMEQKVQKASLPEGDRPLPQGGLIFFQYGGNVKNIRSIELFYNSTAGKAKLTLQP